MEPITNIVYTEESKYFEISDNELKNECRKLFFLGERAAPINPKESADNYAQIIGKYIGAKCKIHENDYVTITFYLMEALFRSKQYDKVIEYGLWISKYKKYKVSWDGINLKLAEAYYEKEQDELSLQYFKKVFASDGIVLLPNEEDKKYRDFLAQNGLNCS